MNATAVAALAARTQTLAEALHACTITIAAVAYAAARGPWRGESRVDGYTHEKIEGRTVAIHFRRALLPGDIKIIPRATTVLVDGVKCTVEAVTGSPNIPGFRLECRATGSAIPQA